MYLLQSIMPLCSLCLEDSFNCHVSTSVYHALVFSMSSGFIQLSCIYFSLSCLCVLYVFRIHSTVMYLLQSIMPLCSLCLEDSFNCHVSTSVYHALVFSMSSGFIQLSCIYFSLSCLCVLYVLRIHSTVMYLLQSIMPLCSLCLEDSFNCHVSTSVYHALVFSMSSGFIQLSCIYFSLSCLCVLYVLRIHSTVMYLLQSIMPLCSLCLEDSFNCHVSTSVYHAFVFSMS